ncbi:hypothetical protein BC941DRAFT_409934 [Chlamydoabsidia padenii]|nr:hypothetical protein BC941DRAFT_409934 [Chlamydoabsidia padenii]
MSGRNSESYNEHGLTLPTYTPITIKPKKTPEEKATAKANKARKDDLDSLQITFYEIESWIEKTTPVLARMTKELDRVSHRFEKPKPQAHQQLYGPPSFPQTQHNQPHIIQQQQQQQEHIPTNDDDSMQWKLSFQPGNNLRLDTNIKSVEQLVDVVQKMRLLAEPSTDNEQQQQRQHLDLQDLLTASTTSTSSLSIPWTGSDQLRLGPSTEYWSTALHRRPRSCFENYRDCDVSTFSKLTENVSPHVLNYACQTYWDCLHPKFSMDWATFWNRQGDPKRNQVCIDSGLAIIFLHLKRHHSDSCPDANEIGYYYFERARGDLMDHFDSPDGATLETLMNLAMFCILWRRHSQARIYIGLAYRMILNMGIYQQSNWPKDDLVLRKQYLKLFMVLYYNDINVSMYSGEPTQLNDYDFAVDFYDLITVNNALSPPPDDKTLVKETFFAHLLSLLKIGKRTLIMMEDYQREHKGKQHVGELPLSWANQVQSLEVALATWFDRLPKEYRVDPQPTALSTSTTSNRSSHSSDHIHVPMDAASLKKRSSLLLMLQYQTQWILLHKTFANIDPSSLSTIFATSNTTPIPPLGSDRSREICTDAADRIVVMGELITENYEWCVCQQFMSCIYQASTIYCRNALCRNETTRQHAKTMIMRVMRILGSNQINYSGLPNDLSSWLSEFLVSNGMHSPGQDVRTNDDGSDGYQLLDQWVSFNNEKQDTLVPTLERFNDTLYNSPHRHLDCLHQSSLYRPPLTAHYHQTDAMLSIKIQEPVVENSIIMDFQSEHRKNWRNVFSSSNITQVNQRML